jgi:hypothetical protein
MGMEWEEGEEWQGATAGRAALCPTLSSQLVTLNLD